MDAKTTYYRPYCSCTSTWCSCGAGESILYVVGARSADRWFDDSAINVPAATLKPAQWARWFDVFRRFWPAPIPRHPQAEAATERNRITQHISAAVRRRWKRRRFVHDLRAAT